MTIGEYIMMLRKEKGLDIQQLSDLSGVSLSALSRIESGDKKKPGPLMLKALVRHLGVSYEHLMAKAGYIEEIVDRERYLEHQFFDDGDIVDIVRKSKFSISPEDDLYRVLGGASSVDLAVISTILSGFIEDAPDDEAAALKKALCRVEFEQEIYKRQLIKEKGN